MNFNIEIPIIINTLNNNGVILCPTDTIWGLSCDAKNRIAIEKVFELKNRPPNKSCIVLMKNEEMLKNFVKDIPPAYYALKKEVKKPTTFIFTSNGILKQPICSAENTIAIRMPNDDFCQEILHQFNTPIISTSANLSGETAPQNFSFINSIIKKNVDYVVQYKQNDASEKSASAIIDLSGDEIRIIRQ
jgi:L-threonylcarbamoyladenylate synthase